uniref:Sulfotransferase family cytosolic 1B member 1 n=1 Tax=Cacopsylla melanoneura TaxID=428564 RepID=A0A8D8UER4_9HEMI
MKGLFMFWTAIALVFMLSNGGCAFSRFDPRKYFKMPFKSLISGGMSWVSRIRKPSPQSEISRSAQDSNLQLPVKMLTFEPITDGTEIGQILKSKFTNSFRTGYVRCKGVCLPEYYTEFAEQILNFDVRDDDVWVCSFPKTGTTWTQEMVWCIANDLDYEGAKVVLPERFPFLELTALFDYRSNQALNLTEEDLNSVLTIQNMKGRRFIKTHLPWNLLPRKLQNKSTKAKIIYVTRNPKDTCISYFHHCGLMEGYTGTLEEFYKLFLNDAPCFAPYWDHVLDFWAVAKKNENILFIKYEGMKKDLRSIISQVASHLSKKLTTDQVESLENHLSFENMKNNPATNYEFVVKFNKENHLIQDKLLDGKFMRSGKVGGYKAQMSSEVEKAFDEWSRKKTEGTDFSFENDNKVFR